MLSWLSSLFGDRNNTVHKIERKKRVTLTNEQRSNIAIDYMINKMKVQDISAKYNVSKPTVYRIINDSRRVQH